MAKKPDHQLRIPDDLWRRVQRAAIDDSSRKGVPVSASEWVRDAVEKKLQSTKERK